MKRYCLAITFLLAGFAMRAQSAEQTVLNLSKKKFEWMIRMEFDSLRAVLDDRLMFVHSNGWSENKREFVEDIKSGKLRYTNIQISEAVARVYPGTAIITGKGKFNVLLDGSSLEFNLFYTEVYILRDRKWLLASRHSNRLP